jgi:glycosyltransferase involved in cell wall biosynthesis/GT2 family glycosyltransferase
MKLKTLALAFVDREVRRKVVAKLRRTIASSRLYVSYIKPIRRWLADCAIRREMNPLRKWNPDAPVFSVVMPVYDRTWELQEAIESILKQTFRNYELILVCDGSPDDTLAVVDKYAAHPQVRVHKYPDNSGNACRGRNTGIKMARGRYIAFMDSDDVSVPERLDVTLFHLLRTGADMAYGSVTIISDGTREIPGIQHGQFCKSFALSLWEMEKVNPVWTCTVAVKKEVLDRCGLFRLEMRYREDHELWLRIAYHGCKLVPIEEMLAYYRLHKNNAELLFKDQDARWMSLMRQMYKRPYYPPVVDAAKQLRELTCQLDEWQFVVLQETAAVAPDDANVARGASPRSLLALVPEAERGSGGQVTIARVLSYLTAKGVKCHVAFYPEVQDDRFPACAGAWLDEFGVDSCPVLRPDEAKAMHFDVALATYWPGAYVVKNCISAASKGYFVQDFEPYFYPPGSIFAFAEETYRLGLWGVCGSPWLAKTLSSEYGMQTASFLYGLNEKEYHLESAVQREKNLVVAYIRRHTPRRGYELIMWALNILKERMPDVRIEIYGDATLPKGEVLWVDRNHGVLSHDEMRMLYNRASVGIVTSFTNYSIVPNEMIACGCAVVDLDTPCTRSAFPPGVITLVQATPQRLAEAAQSLLSDDDRRATQVRKGLEYAPTISWERSLASIHSAICEFSGGRMSPRTTPQDVQKDAALSRPPCPQPAGNHDSRLLRIDPASERDTLHEHSVAANQHEMASDR